MHQQIRSRFNVLASSSLICSSFGHSIGITPSDTMVNPQILRSLYPFIERLREDNLLVSHLLSSFSPPGSYPFSIQWAAILNSRIFATGSRDITTTLSISVHLSSLL